MRTKGIDISRAQEQFDFTAAVSSGVKFVIIRAGIGRDEDTYFRRNIEQCRKLGIDFGCYWYVTATDSEELDRQINACVKVIGDEKPSYPVFCDMEEQRQIDNLTSKERTDMALEFCNRLNKAGLPSGVYANPAWLESYYQKERIVGKRDIWLAHWTESPDYASRYDYGQKMWQWGIDSIAGKDVDGDICFVDYPAITAKWYKENCGDMPEKPEKPVNLFKKGDSVRVKRGARFTNGVEPYSYVYDTIYTVQQVSASGKETLIGIGSVPTGWLYTENLYRWSSRLRQIAFPRRVLPTDVLLNRIFFFQRTTEVNVPLFNPTENRVLSTLFSKIFSFFLLPDSQTSVQHYIRTVQSLQFPEMTCHSRQTIGIAATVLVSALQVQARTPANP